jgi:hypothetical protein
MGWRSSRGGGGAHNVQGERIWSSLGWQKVKRWLLVIHILCSFTKICEALPIIFITINSLSIKTHLVDRTQRKRILEHDHEEQNLRKNEFALARMRPQA